MLFSQWHCVTWCLWFSTTAPSCLNKAIKDEYFTNKKILPNQIDEDVFIYLFHIWIELQTLSCHFCKMNIIFYDCTLTFTAWIDYILKLCTADTVCICSELLTDWYWTWLIQFFSPLQINKLMQTVKQRATFFECVTINFGVISMKSLRKNKNHLYRLINQIQ